MSVQKNFDKWIQALDFYLEQGCSAIKSYEIDKEVLWYGFAHDQTPSEFLSSGFKEKQEIPSGIKVGETVCDTEALSELNVTGPPRDLKNRIQKQGVGMKQKGWKFLLGYFALLLAVLSSLVIYQNQRATNLLKAKAKSASSMPGALNEAGAWKDTFTSTNELRKVQDRALYLNHEVESVSWSFGENARLKSSLLNYSSAMFEACEFEIDMKTKLSRIRDKVTLELIAINASSGDAMRQFAEHGTFPMELNAESIERLKDDPDFPMYLKAKNIGLNSAETMTREWKVIQKYLGD